MDEVRLIDANELKALRELYIQGKLQFIGNEYDLIDKCPTIDAEPVRHGQWIKGKTEKLYFSYGMEGYYDYPKLCSVCHYDATENGCGVGNYCSNCGAKMDRGANRWMKLS